MQIQLKRFHQDERQTVGIITWMDRKAFTIERPWLGNARDISCVPAAVYLVQLLDINGKDRIRLRNVPMRGLINIEVGNFVGDSRGCIFIAQSVSAEREFQLKDSRPAYRRLLGDLKALGPEEKHTIEIINP